MDAFGKLAAATFVGMFTLTLAAAPASAADRRRDRTPPKPSGMLASAQAHVQRIARSTNAAKSASTPQTVSEVDDPGSFFRSRRGVAVLVLAAAGIGYVWYSLYHDRLGSPARDRLDD